ncbi:MAG TPA: phosphoribosylformylglycinamidine synthase subunit PurS [Actinomycetota bacterium]|nr:phosphoribosylformylglycinamidine synthase subunit PurS [Actinomycetota bacterium]
MRYRFEVLVTLKPGLADPQGKAVEASLPAIGFANVTDVQVGRHVGLDVEATSEPEARAQVEEVARRLLSNPVIEDFRVLEPAETDAGS